MYILQPHVCFVLADVVLHISYKEISEETFFCFYNFLIEYSQLDLLCIHFNLCSQWATCSKQWINCYISSLVHKVPRLVIFPKICNEAVGAFIYSICYVHVFVMNNWY